LHIFQPLVRCTVPVVRCPLQARGEVRDRGAGWGLGMQFEVGVFFVHGCQRRLGRRRLQRCTCHRAQVKEAGKDQVKGQAQQGNVGGRRLKGMWEKESGSPGVTVRVSGAGYFPKPKGPDIINLLDPCVRSGQVDGRVDTRRCALQIKSNQVRGAVTCKRAVGRWQRRQPSV
jgi:hypothetical protein